MELNNLVDAIHLPENIQGIYGLFLNNECVYIGQSSCVRSRVISHLLECTKVDTEDKYTHLSRHIDKVQYAVLEQVKHEQDLTSRENAWIAEYKPIFNKMRPDGIHIFVGNENDIDAFVDGKVTMDFLKSNKMERISRRRATLGCQLDHMWLNKPLYTKDKCRLCTELNVGDSRGRLVGWTTLKQVLTSNGFSITDIHTRTGDYSIITYTTK